MRSEAAAEATRHTPQCYFCHWPFPANGADDFAAHGNTIAYDPGRGRLWLVCENCRRWSLTPIEERWETLEALERVCSSGARLLAQTENIALLDTGSIRLVRVGRAGLREQAWWRYGHELARRHERTLQVARRGEVIDTVLDAITPIINFLLVGWPFQRRIEPGVEPWLDHARWKDFGPFAWRGETRCAVCRELRQEILLQESEEMVVRPAGVEEYELWVPCRQCRLLRTAQSGYELQGLPARRVLRRVLAYQNYDGGSERQIDSATRLIEEAGAPAALIRRLVYRNVPLGRFKSTELLSLEISSNEEEEQRLAELELAELEARWKQEEAIAALVDGELTPWPRLILRAGFSEPR